MLQKKLVHLYISVDICMCVSVIFAHVYSEGKNIWSAADFVRLPTDKEMMCL